MDTHKTVIKMDRYKAWEDADRKEPLTSAATSQKTDAIRKCLVSGLFPNAAYLHMSGTYRTVRGDIPLVVHPTSGKNSSGIQPHL
jgi:hypothetical protein